MAETVIAPEELKSTLRRESLRAEGRVPSTSLFALWLTLARNRRLFIGIVGALVAACLVYCLVAPNEYEAVGKVELKSSPDSVLASDRRDAVPSGSFASGPVQLETLANVLRSEQLAWDVITRLGMYKERAFSRRFKQKYSDFNPDRPSADSKEYLLRAFRKRLTVAALPHTLVIDIRFRSQDAATSAAVVNELIEAYGRNETNSRMQGTRSRREWLNAELRALKERVEEDDVRLGEFQRKHGILSISRSAGDGRWPEQHSSAVVALDALDRELLNATTDRILREAEYRAATSADANLVFSTERRSGSGGNPELALLQQLYVRRSELQQEQTQLEIEHGSNFPRLIEIRKQMEDANLQIKAVDGRLVASFRSAWKTALDREALVRKSRDEAAETGLKLSGAALAYATMWEEANANREMYVKLKQQSDEAELAAGSRGSAMQVIDYARQPAMPVSPNPAIDMAIMVFGGFWLSLAVVLGKEALWKNRMNAASLMVCMALGLGTSNGQAPTPNTSGLPTGAAGMPQTGETKSTPNVKDAPAVWGSGQSSIGAGAPSSGPMPTQVMDAPIGAGDMLEVTEAHGSELRATVRVSQAGTAMLPLCGEVKLEGMDEQSAARAIEAALKEKGMLLRPQVTVLVTAHAGLDVSVLGEVTRPGVYSYAVHHRLLDLISAASGLNQNAGRLVTITHRNDPENTLVVVLAPSGSDVRGDHNPELLPGDTVQVERVGLVYVVGDVIRPGGFPVDPVQAITVVQALSLAWGPAQNAALKKAVLIREQPGGRTVTTLNLKRMLRGLDPDLPIRDRDILFVPDSMAKNLLNRSLESVIQSAVGVSIYSGLVYSQRF